jgi:hypothetical protein
VSLCAVPGEGFPTGFTGSSDEPVVVIVDMDASTPGYQANVDVPPGQSVVEGVAVFVFDPLEARAIYDIGFIGGVDRGISLGHVPGAGNQGSVARLSATAGLPVNPANFVYVIPSSALDPAFPGPEVQYLETGAAETAIIGASPAGPIFTVDVHLDGAEEGDVFDFYLLDFIVVWSGGQYGAFSTKGPLSLDTGGDAVPDSTRTLHGVDPDSAIAVPPAAFLVDFIDGGETPGPATITIVGPIGTDGETASPRPALRLHPGWPNPFRAATTLRYDLAAPGWARLALYDAAGRMVRELLNGSHARPGRYDVGWDGRDGFGRSVGPGVYVARLESEHGHETRRIVRVY